MSVTAVSLKTVTSYTGLAADTKPAPTLALAGAIFIEADTAKTFMCDGVTWYDVTALAAIILGGF